MLYSNSRLVILTCLIYGLSSSSLVPSRNHHVRRAIDRSVLLGNGKAAQKLNAKFSSMTTDSPCQTGDAACIAGGFYQCVAGKYVGGPCAQGLKCFAMPLLLRNGTSLGCDTEADAKTRITDTGATGGLTGTDSSDTTASRKSSEASSDSDNENMDGTASDSTEKKDDSIDSMQTDADNNTNATAIMNPNSSNTSGISVDNKAKSLKNGNPSLGITDDNSGGSKNPDKHSVSNPKKSESTIPGDKKEDGDRVEKEKNPKPSKDASEEEECQDDDDEEDDHNKTTN